jgi:hypothetical protein
MNCLIDPTKGLSLMYDSGSRPEAEEERAVLPQVSSRPELAKPLLVFLQMLLGQPGVVAPLPHRGRGAPPKLLSAHLCLALLQGVLCQAQHLSTIWRLLVLAPVGSFAPVHVTYEAMRTRLLCHGPALLQDCFQTLSRALGQWMTQQHPQAHPLAPFARAVLALDETTLDALRRLTAPLRGLPAGDAHLLPGKLAGLFDVRAQRWVRLQFRADVLAGCTIGILLLLEGLAPGTLLLADLGYVSFPWFEYLTSQGFWWVSRLKENVTIDLVQVLAYDDHTGFYEALVWLGKYRADRAAQVVRLVSFYWQGQQYRYITNVLDPAQLSVSEIVELYARRWDIELAFKLLKCELGLHLWWGARPEIVLAQLWIALILAQLLHAFQVSLAWQAGVDPFDVSLHMLVELLPVVARGQGNVLDRLLSEGRFVGLIRPSSRIHRQVPMGDPSRWPAVPADPPRPRHARYAGRNPHPRTAPFVSHFTTQLLI